MFDCFFRFLSVTLRAHFTVALWDLVDSVYLFVEYTLARNHVEDGPVARSVIGLIAAELVDDNGIRTEFRLCVNFIKALKFSLIAFCRGRLGFRPGCILTSHVLALRGIIEGAKAIGQKPRGYKCSQTPTHEDIEGVIVWHGIP